MMRQVNVGDVALIAVKEVYVPAKVLYLSRRYKDVILLGIYAVAYTTNAMPSDLPDQFGDLVYTSQVPILKNRWHHVGHEPIRRNQVGLATRVVAGNVWKEDELVRPASEADLKTLPQMQVLGAALVEKRAGMLIVD